MTGTKQILIIAGPNGAGKTTFAMEYLPNEAQLSDLCHTPDLIASHPEQSRKVELAGIEAALIRAGERWIPQPGAGVTPEIAKTRRPEGGHDVPESVIRRRFEPDGVISTRLRVDDWAIYDNSNPVLLEKESR